MSRRPSYLRCAPLAAALALSGCGGRSSLDIGASITVDGSGAGPVDGSGAGPVDTSGAGPVDGGGAGPGPSTAHACAPGCLALDFARRFDHAEPLGLAVDARGNILVAGYFEGTVDFGGGPLVSSGNLDAFVLKLDALGNHLWSRRFGDISAALTDDQVALWISADASGDIVVGGRFVQTIDFGGGYLTGGSGSNGFVAVFDASGQHRWSRAVRAQDANLRAVAFHPAGGVVVAGDYAGTLDLGAGPFTSDVGGYNVFAARLDASGGHVWSRSFGGQSAQEPTAALDAAGNLVLGGEFHGVIDFGGGPIETTGFSEGDQSSDIFVASLGPDGEHRWSRSIGSVDGEDHRGTAVDGAGNVATLGVFFGTLEVGGATLQSDGYDVFVTKLSVGGAPLFARRFASADALAADAAGNTWLTGAFTSDADYGCGPLTTRYVGLLVAGLDPRGNGLCSVSFEPSESGGLSRIAVDPTDGSVVVAGTFQGTIDLGDGPLSSPSMRQSMLIARLIP
ncbi:hypothetical protein [Sorangium sp. So ce1024]|uniref:hypothetical protein n=1 Tax=Sorangium sp. So ce1024 TaxID=3133327 RepID=UPI003F10660A